jgi:hypothetical protein
VRSGKKKGSTCKGPSSDFWFKEHAKSAMPILAFFWFLAVVFV